MGGGDNWKFVLWEERDDGSLYKLEVSFEFSRGKVRCLVKSNGELTHIQNAEIAKQDSAALGMDVGKKAMAYYKTDRLR